jgi:tetratricopeptide (TPR) repeat protein
LKTNGQSRNENEIYTKVFIKKEWDSSPHIEENKRIKYHHAIREEERDLLIDFLYRRNEGVLLLSGNRGVGKSSIVFTTIHETIKKCKAERIKLLPILINAPTFEIYESKQKDNDKEQKNRGSSENKDYKTAKEEDQSVFKRIILQNIVRRLYQTLLKEGIILSERDIREKGLSKINKKIIKYYFKVIKKKFEIKEKEKESSLDDVITLAELRNKVSDLFRRAVAKEVKHETNIKELEQQKYKLERATIRNLKIPEKLIGSSFASIILALLIIFDVIPIKGYLKGLLPVIVASIPPIIMSWQVQKTVTSQHEEEIKASIYYLYDYDISTFEAEIEQTLKDLSKEIIDYKYERFKVVFVIDELDKLPPDKVIQVITSLKTLFNQTLCLFVLITGKEFFDLMIKQSKDRGMEYTLFTQKIFLQRPKAKEIDEYLDKIVKDENKEFENKDEFKELFKTFKKYVCYKSRSDYFDLYNSLRDHIKHDSKDGKPILNIILEDQKQLIQANAQKVIEQIYERKESIFVSGFYKNDIMLHKMYDLMSFLLSLQSKAEFTITENDTNPYLVLSYDSKSGYIVPTDLEKINEELEANAIMDLLTYLDKLQFLNISYKSKPKIKHIKRTDLLLIDVHDSPNFYTTEETEFISEYEKYAGILIIFSNIYTMYVEKNKDKRYKKSELKSTINEITEVIRDKLGLLNSYFSNTKINSKFNIDKIFFDLTRQIEDKEVRQVYKREKLEEAKDKIITLRSDLSNNFILFLKNILKENQYILSKDIEIHEKGTKSTTVLSKIDLRDFPNNLYIKSDIDKRELFLFYNPPTDFLDKIKQNNKSDGSINKTFYYILKTDKIKIDEISKDIEKDYYSLQFDENNLLCQIPSYLDKFWFNNISPFIVNESFHLNEKLIENIIDSILSWYNNTPINEWNKEAIYFYNLIEYEQAIKTLDKIIRVYDNNDYLISNISKLILIVALNNTGLCFIKLSKFYEAIESFTKSFNIDSDIDFPFIIKIASFLVDIQREIDALAVYDKIIRKNPIDSVNKGNADLWIKIRRIDKAKEAYDKALAEYDKALAGYDKAIEKNPTAYYYYKDKADLLVKLNRVDEALAGYDKAIEKDPDHSYYYYKDKADIWVKLLSLIFNRLYRELISLN